MLPVETVSKYFLAWQDHNLSLLRQIFDSNAQYTIVSKNLVFNGIEEICKYWQRNKERQQNLRVIWWILNVEESSVRCKFIATFYDNQEQQQQEISGLITYRLGREGIIISLSETYQKKSLTSKGRTASGRD